MLKNMLPSPSRWEAQNIGGETPAARRPHGGGARHNPFAGEELASPQERPLLLLTRRYPRALGERHRSLAERQPLHAICAVKTQDADLSPTMRPTSPHERPRLLLRTQTFCLRGANIAQFEVSIAAASSPNERPRLLRRTRSFCLRGANIPQGSLRRRLRNSYSAKKQKPYGRVG